MVFPSRPFARADDGGDSGEWQNDYVLNTLPYNIQDGVHGPTVALREPDLAPCGYRRSLCVWGDGWRRPWQYRHIALRLLLGQEHRGALVHRYLGRILRD